MKAQTIIVFIISLLLLGVLLPIGLSDLTEYDWTYATSTSTVSYSTIYDNWTNDATSQHSITADQPHSSYLPALLFGQFNSSGSNTITNISVFGRYYASGDGYSYSLYIINSTWNGTAYIPHTTYTNAYAKLMNVFTTATQVDATFTYSTNVTLDNSKTTNNIWFLTIEDGNGDMFAIGYNSNSNVGKTYKLSGSTYLPTSWDLCFNITFAPITLNHTIISTIALRNASIGTLVGSILPILIVVSVIIGFVSSKKHPDY